MKGMGPATSLILPWRDGTHYQRMSISQFDTEIVTAGC